MSDDKKWSVQFRLTRFDISRYVIVKQDALMESLSSNLDGFLNQIQGNLSVPDKKFLRDGFIGLVRTAVRLRGDRDLMRFYAVSERSDDGRWIAMETRQLAERTSSTPVSMSGGTCYESTYEKIGKFEKK